MNAKIAAAISLRASSLVLIGSIGIANASTTDPATTLTPTNTVFSATTPAALASKLAKALTA